MTESCFYRLIDKMELQEMLTSLVEIAKTEKVRDNQILVA